MIIPLTILFGVGAVAELLPPRPVKLIHSERLNKRGSSSGFTTENQLLDSRYLIDVKIGTPEQIVPITLSTLQPVFTVYGRPKAAEGTDAGFLAEKSSSYKAEEKAIRPNGTNHFVWAKDVVSFGGESHEAKIHYSDAGFPLDASFGFAFPNMRHEEKSYWHQACEGWADKQVGLFLSRHRGPNSADAPDQWKESELMIGGVNKDRISGDIKYYSFTPDETGGWQVPLRGISVNGKAIEMSSGIVELIPGCQSGLPGQVLALVSVGEYNTFGPWEVVKRFYENIPGAELTGEGSQQTWTFPCETAKIDIKLDIGGDEYTMQSRDMVAGLARCDGVATETGTTKMCVGAIQGWSFDEWSIGSSFLRNVYTAFRFDPPAVGFAKLPDNAQSDLPNEVGKVDTTSSPGLADLVSSLTSPLPAETKPTASATLGTGISAIAVGAAAVAILLL